MNKNVEIFNEKGYCLVPDVLSDETVSIINLYTRFDEFNNFTVASDNQVPGAHSKYGDLVMESLLSYLQPIVEENTGLELFPTYSYYRVYRGGDELKPHVDRPSCEISVTICLGFDYKDDTLSSWPIYIGDKRCSLNPGDMAIYKGMELIHYREPLKASKTAYHSQAFLHYVNKNGPYKEFKFDRRQSIGVS